MSDTTPALSEALYDQLWTAIAEVRDASPRLPDDADTDDIITALIPAMDRYVTDRARAAADAYTAAAQDTESATDRAVRLVRADTLTLFADNYEAGLR